MSLHILALIVCEWNSGAMVFVQLHTKQKLRYCFNVDFAQTQSSKCKVAEGRRTAAYLVRCFCVGSGVKQFFDNQDVALFHRVKQRCLSFLSGNKSHIRLNSLLSNSYHGSRTFNRSWYFTTLKKKHANDGVSSRRMLSISSSIHCPITQTLSKQPLIRNICLVAQRHDTLTRQVWVQGKCLITILEDAAVKKFSKATKTSSVYVPCSLPFNRDSKYFCNQLQLYQQTNLKKKSGLIR